MIELKSVLGFVSTVMVGTLLPVAAGAGTIEVCWDGSGDATTMQAGINLAGVSDEVVVCPGTYTGPGNRAIDFNGKALTVRSSAGAEATIIDCQHADRAFRFHSSEGADSVLDGFTIVNGQAADAPYDGGGIHCDGASPTIRNCRIIANRSADQGGGIFCYQSDVILNNCLISGNDADDFGGGVHLDGGSVLLVGCTISGNRAAFAGGGIYATATDLTAVGCRFVGNTAQYYGAAMALYTGTTRVINGLITGNVTAGSGAGAYLFDTATQIGHCSFRANAAFAGGAISFGNNGTADVVNSVLWANTPDTFRAGTATLTVQASDVEGGWPGAGNINADPLFGLPAQGNWTASPVYDAAGHTVTFTDAGAAWESDAWIGTALRPNMTQALELPIVANTSTTVTVLADALTVRNGLSAVPASAAYRVTDDHLIWGSPCVDAANTALVPADVVDLDGDSDTTEPTPLDLGNRPRRVACRADLGPLENQDHLHVAFDPDLDPDCDVDEDDLGIFDACVRGPAVVQSAPECLRADFDLDQDVDQSDFGLFQRCFSGPDAAFDPSCTD